MYNFPFKLFKFIYTNEKNANETMYIISNNWPSAFKEVYNALDDNNANIISAELLANEYINLIIDNNYVITKMPQREIDPDDYNIIKGIKRYPTENF